MRRGIVVLAAVVGVAALGLLGLTAVSGGSVRVLAAVTATPSPTWTPLPAATSRATATPAPKLSADLVRGLASRWTNCAWKGGYAQYTIVDVTYAGTRTWRVLAEGNYYLDLGGPGAKLTPGRQHADGTEARHKILWIVDDETRQVVPGELYRGDDQARQVQRMCTGQ